MMSRLVNLVVVCLIWAPLGYSDSMSQKLSQAAQAYQEGDLETAVSVYQDLFDSGHKNGYLLFNLGNSYYKQQSLGKALAAYQSAKVLIPRDVNLEKNIAIISNELSLNEELTPFRLEKKLSMADWLSPRETAHLATFLWVAACLLILVYKLLLPTRTVLFYAGLCLSSLSIYLAGWLAANEWRNVHHFAAVDTTEAPVLGSPSRENAVVLFNVKEGQPLSIVRKEGAWYEIELHTGKRGWLSEDEVAHFPI
ncbi:MAG: hypothetical protein HRU19_03425 [Pseudobacteriovorax sp.]|nr:hypothetical protein [Pseudobacteriovorax sp.]